MSHVMRRVMSRLLVLCVSALVLVGGLAAPAVAFPDVAAEHVYATAIAELSTRGVITGYSDGTFRPDAPVWRQHFAKMIVLTLGLPYAGVTTCPFTDVTKSYPYPAGFVAVAFANGITNGKTASTFAPTAEISRAQVITMVVRAAQELLPGRLDAVPEGLTGTWGVGFDPTHGPNALVAEYNGLLAGIPLGTGGPLASMPRGEVAQVLHNLLVRMAAVPPAPDAPLLPGDPWAPPDIPPPPDVPLPPDSPWYPPDFPPVIEIPPPPDVPPSGSAPPSFLMD
ncbi:MAG: S-layer homology domain-containing protein [Thermoleophilia bacterium]